MYLMLITYVTGDTDQEAFPTKAKALSRILDLVDDVKSIEIKRMR
jgi:hypothetical protein